MMVPAQPAADRVKPGRLVLGYVSFLRRFRWAVLLAVVAVGGVSAWFAPGFVTATSEDFSAPDGTSAKKDRDLMQDLFPDQKTSSDLVLFVAAAEGVTLDFTASSPLRAFSDRLRDETSAYRPNGWTGPLLARFASYWSMLEDFGGQGEEFAAPFRPAGNESTFFELHIRSSMTSTVSRDFAKFIRDHVDGWQKDTHTASLEMSLLGEAAFVDVMVDDAMSDVERMDSVVLPIAVLVLAWLLRSLRLVVLPLVCLGFAAATSFAIMYVVAERTQVFSGVSALMMSILIAMSIDYGLFLCSRYREEIERSPLPYGPETTPRAVAHMLSTAGHTISVSGLTLAACFFGTLVFPVTIMKTLGAGCGVMLLCVLGSNLVLIPLLLLMMPKVFEKCVLPGPCCPPRLWCTDPTDPVRASLPCRGDEESDGRSVEEEEEPSPSPSVPLMQDYEGGPESVLGVDTDSRLYAFALKTVTFPFNLAMLVVVVGIVIPFSLYAFGPAITNEQSLFLPVDSKPYKAYNRMGETFGFGQVYSYQLLMVPTDSRNLTADGGAMWTATQEALYAMSDPAVCPQIAALTSVHNMTGASMAGGRNVSLSQAEFCCAVDATRGAGHGCPPLTQSLKDFNASEVCEVLAPPAVRGLCPKLAGVRLTDNLTEDCGRVFGAFGLPPDQCPDYVQKIQQQCGGLALSWRTFVNPTATALYAQWTPMFDPMDVVGRNWLHHARDCVDSFPDRYGLTMHFISEAADGLAVMDTLFRYFPLMIAVTGVVVLIFVGVAFRSVFIPLRAVFTIGCTLAFVFGFADLTYEHGALSGIHWSGFHGFMQTHALIYFDPLFTFAVIVGLGLDYDTFLLTRIVEYRDVLSKTHKPKDATRMAIVAGLTKTAGIISWAGVIMAVAFLGLMLSKEPVLNQLSFFMVFAVLFDTFVVRSVLVPACMSLLGELNWWPMALSKQVAAEQDTVHVQDSGIHPPSVAVERH